MRGWIKRIFWCFALCAGVWAGGLSWFVAGIPSAPAADQPQADAIVVLTGGEGRLERGMELLAEEKAETLFISGAGKNVSVADVMRQVSPALSARVGAKKRARIVLGHEAENTIGNAEEIKRWLERQPKQTIRLVTANYHMPRSISELKAVLPQLTIIPEPVFPADFPKEGWWKKKESRQRLMSEYHKFLASKLRHWLLTALPSE